MKSVILSLALAALVATPAFATDFKSEILDTAGKAVPMCDRPNAPECQKPLTLGVVVSTALLTPFPDESDPRSGATLAPDQKVRRAILALRVQDAGELSLPAEDVALAKQVVGKAYPPLIVYRAWSLLDPASVKAP
jgi:hypothetical protein